MAHEADKTRFFDVVSCDNCETLHFDTVTASYIIYRNWECERYYSAPFTRRCLVHEHAATYFA